MRKTREEQYDETSETILVINSESRTSGSTQQYTVPINPPLHDIVEVQLLSFDGIVKPYNVLADQEYNIFYTTFSDPLPLLYSVVMWTVAIGAGSYRMIDLLEMLNSNPNVHFAHDIITGRITIEMRNTILQATPSTYPCVWADCPVINQLLGFNSTFASPLPNPPDSFLERAQWQIYSTNSTDRAIQTTYPTSITTKPRPIQLAFENIGGQLSSSNNIGGCFVVSVDPVDPLTNESVVSWKSNKDFEQKTRTNHIRLANIGIRLCDSIDGSPYKYPGEHTIIMKATWYNNK